MLLTIALILVILWLLGFAVHLASIAWVLLIIAAVVIIFDRRNRRL